MPDQRRLQILQTLAARLVEHSVFTLVSQIGQREPTGTAQVHKTLTVPLQCGERNPCVARVMVGNARVFEHERASATPGADAPSLASVLTAFSVGRLQRYSRSGFERSPTEHLDVALGLLAA